MDSSRFLGMMGTVFSFVASDVHSKLKILQTFRQSEKSSHYEDVKSMAKYETENSVIKTEGNGCRTLLRLHRALLFIIKLFEDISNASNHDSMATVAHNAYSATLAQYHTWLIRKAVGVAVYTLPSRQSFLQKFGASTEQETLDQVKDLVGKMYTVYNEVQKIYEEYNILQLP